MAFPQAVNDKNTALLNALAVDLKALEVEDAELVKNLATLPNGHPSIAALNLRHAAIRTAHINHA